MEPLVVLGGKDYLACCGSVKFAEEMVLAGPFSDYQQAVTAARDIWFNKVDVNGWLEAFAAHPPIGENPSMTHKSPTSAQWSKGEQSTALAAATDATLQELQEWSVRYKRKFGFIFLIFASGRSTSTPEMLAEMKRRYHNRPIVELELAAHVQMKITEFRLSKLFTVNSAAASQIQTQYTVDVKKAGDRVDIIVAHLTAANDASVVKPSQTFTRTRPPITTHVLDVAYGSPATGIKVLLEMWKNNQRRPLLGEADSGGWTPLGSSTTDKGRSVQLINMVDVLSPGIYRISLNTGRYNPEGFFSMSLLYSKSGSRRNWNIFMFLFCFRHFHSPLIVEASLFQPANKS